MHVAFHEAMFPDNVLEDEIADHADEPELEREPREEDRAGGDAVVRGRLRGLSQGTVHK